MVATLAQARTWSSTLKMQLQTDPFLMPIENAAMHWPTSCSPRIPVADDPYPAADIRFARADRVRARPDLQPVAFHCRAPAAGQRQPRAQANVLGAVTAPAADEPSGAVRADRRRAVSWLRPADRDRPTLGRPRRQVAQRPQAREEEVPAPADRHESRAGWSGGSAPARREWRSAPPDSGR